ncbi:fungal specific transcription [Pyrenophora seminiperda CCB06]|uniref:Fungal specific transcription n=1 Tax=Pyrenophora seminiperda CCB06 TaxID=1302712 RepID=A0A3M7M628_9PLEO|nr:fungal specific transcription [Pyrenophora seminiperda CCB06]
MHSYASQYPTSIDFDIAYKNFFERFYAASDAPGAEAHDQYTTFFAEDATLIMASKQVQGRAEIKSLREAMWEKVASRVHEPVKIFPFGPNADEVMLYGTVKYGLKAGGESSKDWAARAQLVKDDDGKVMLKFYQVYLGPSSAW